MAKLAGPPTSNPPSGDRGGGGVPPPPPDRDPFRLIERGNAMESSGNLWSAADSFGLASSMLRSEASYVADRIAEDEAKYGASSSSPSASGRSVTERAASRSAKLGERRKIAKLYLEQSREYLHRGRDCLLRALNFETAEDRRRAAQAEAMSGPLGRKLRVLIDQAEPLVGMISDDERRRRRRIFGRLYAGGEEEREEEAAPPAAEAEGAKAEGAKAEGAKADTETDIGPTGPKGGDASGGSERSARDGGAGGRVPPPAPGGGAGGAAVDAAGGGTTTPRRADPEPEGDDPLPPPAPGSDPEKSEGDLLPPPAPGDEPGTGNLLPPPAPFADSGRAGKGGGGGGGGVDGDDKERSLEDRLRAFESSLPPSIKSEKERMDEIRRGLGRLGLTVPDGGASIAKVFQNHLSEEEQIKQIMEMAADEARLEGHDVDSGGIVAGSAGDGGAAAAGDLRINDEDDLRDVLLKAGMTAEEISGEAKIAEALGEEGARLMKEIGAGGGGGGGGGGGLRGRAAALRLIGEAQELLFEATAHLEDDEDDDEEEEEEEEEGLEGLELPKGGEKKKEKRADLSSGVRKGRASLAGARKCLEQALRSLPS